MLIEEAFQILEINSDTEFNEIKKKYHELARKWHPDKNPDNIEVAGEKTKLIIKAYSTLCKIENKKNEKHNEEEMFDCDYNNECMKLKNAFFRDYEYTEKHLKEICATRLQEIREGKPFSHSLNYFKEIKNLNNQTRNKITEEAKELKIPEEITKGYIKFGIKPKEQLNRLIRTDKYYTFGSTFRFFQAKFDFAENKQEQMIWLKKFKDCFVLKNSRFCKKNTAPNRYYNSSAAFDANFDSKSRPIEPNKPYLKEIEFVDLNLNTKIQKPSSDNHINKNALSITKNKWKLWKHKWNVASKNKKNIKKKIEKNTKSFKILERKLNVSNKHTIPQNLENEEIQQKIKKEFFSNTILYQNIEKLSKNDRKIVFNKEFQKFIKNFKNWKKDNFIFTKQKNTTTDLEIRKIKQNQKIKTQTQNLNCLLQQHTTTSTSNTTKLNCNLDYITKNNKNEEINCTNNAKKTNIIKNKNITKIITSTLALTLILYITATIIYMFKNKKK